MEDKKVIQYYSNDVQRIIDKYITEYKYGDFSEILADIFQRRTYEYRLSNEELENDLKTFIKRVQKIQVVPKDFFEGRNASAWYLAGKRKIEVSDELFEEFSERFSGDRNRIGKEFYAVFAHEVYHAISHKKDDEIGLSVKIPFQSNPSNVVMNESFTEVASSRTIYERDEKNLESCLSPVSGYNVVSFVPNLLANAVGLTEREILKAGMQGIDELDKLICSKFPEDKKRDVKNLLGKFELHLQAYYKIVIDDNFARTVRGNDLLKHQICEITKSVYGLNYLQMVNDERNITEDLVDEFSYRNGSILKIFEHNEQVLLKAGILSENDIESINIGVKLSGNIDLKSRDIINEYKEHLEEIDKSYKVGQSNLYEEKIKSEDYHDFFKWDNEEIFDKTLEVFEKERKNFNFRKVQGVGLRIVRKVAGALKKVFNKNKSLLEGRSIYDEEEVGYKTYVSGLEDIKVEGVKYNPRLNVDNKSEKKDKQVEDSVK